MFNFERKPTEPALCILTLSSLKRSEAKCTSIWKTKRKLVSGEGDQGSSALSVLCRAQSASGTSAAELVPRLFPALSPGPALPPLQVGSAAATTKEKRSGGLFYFLVWGGYGSFFVVDVRAGARFLQTRESSAQLSFYNLYTFSEMNFLHGFS